MPKHLISAIKSCAVATACYGAGIVKWTEEEINESNRKTRKTLLNLYGPYAGNDCLYMQRANGGMVLLNVVT